MRESNVPQGGNILRWEMWGILFIIFLGGALHFTFDLSGGWRPLGIISAVNEGVWEHLKLAFWPAIFWGIIEYFFLRRTGRDTRPNFILAKAAGAYSMVIIIVVIFYSYTLFTQEPVLSTDLVSFVIAVVAGQFISYGLWRSLRLPPAYNLAGAAMIIIAALLFAVFTFITPEAGIFRDPATGGYGIVNG